MLLAEVGALLAAVAALLSPSADVEPLALTRVAERLRALPVGRSGIRPDSNLVRQAIGAVDELERCIARLEAALRELECQLEAGSRQLVAARAYAATPEAPC